MAHSDRPTAKQLTLLRTLAEQRGQSFAYPTTRSAASREIDRLLRTPRSSRADRALDRTAVSNEPRGGSTAVRPSEIEGYGSSAHWRGTGS